jgi:hypothetical protein
MWPFFDDPPDVRESQQAKNHSGGDDVSLHSPPGDIEIFRRRLDTCH